MTGRIRYGRIRTLGARRHQSPAKYDAERGRNGNEDGTPEDGDDKDGIEEEQRLYA